LYTTPGTEITDTDLGGPTGPQSFYRHSPDPVGQAPLLSSNPTGSG